MPYLAFAPLVALVIWLAWQVRRDLRRPRCRDCGVLVGERRSLCDACLKRQMASFWADVARPQAEPPTPDADRLLRSLEE